MDEQLVASLVQQRFTDIAATTVRRVGEGWDNEVFLVDDTWMFRFPRYAEQVPWLEREIELMPVVGGALGPLVPAFEKIGEPSDAFPYPFVGYRRLDGVGSDTVVLRDADALATDVADAYTRLHTVDASRVSRTPDGWEDDTWEHWRTHNPEDVEELAALLPADVRERALPFILGAVDPPPPAPSRVLVHNDIGADHVLVDPSTGRLTGLIDWSDAMVGDAVLDFVGLIQIGGWDFVRSVVTRYGREIDDAFVTRLVWATRTLTLQWLAELNDESDVDPSVTDRGHLLWVLRAFEEA